MSWVTSTIETLQPLLQVAQHVEDLALDDDVERGHRLVGDQQLGLQRERDGDGDALAHAAGELVRIVGQPPLVEADHVEQLDRARREPRRAMKPPRSVSTSIDLRADACRPGRASSWRSAG